MIKTVESLVAEADDQVETMTVAQVEAESGDDLVLVDLRDIRELYREGKISNAVHAPRGMLEFWVDPASPYHREVFSSGKKLVFYCQVGWRSALATKTVQDMGLTNVAHLGGGYKAWVESGGDTEPVTPKPPKT